MRKYYNYIIFASFYVAATLTALNAAFRLPEHMTHIMVGFAVGAVISLCMIIFGMRYAYKERIRKYRESILDIMHRMNAMAILWDADFRYVEVNDELTKSIGYTSEDLMDVKQLKKVLPPDAFSPSLQAIVNNRDEEFTVTAKGGAKVCVVWNTSIINSMRTRTGEHFLMLSVGFDMTESIAMRQELADQKQRYTMSMELSEIGIVLKESGDPRYYLSDQFCKMMGISEPHVLPEEFREKLFENDVAVFDALAAQLVNTNIDSNTIHSAEFRATGEDGKYHWFQFRYKITPNKSKLLASIGGAVIDITSDKEKDLLIEKMAYIDDVTQINNRNRFMQIGQEAFECSQDTDLSYWVIVLDIDNFHIVNDTCGYESGNNLLSDFARIIENVLTKGGFGARIGGDNFALLVHDTGDEELPVKIIREIQRKLKAVCGDNFTVQSVTCSAGYCKMSDGGNDFAEVLDHAEFSLNTMSERKSDIIRYDNKIHDKIIEETALEAEIARGIENKEFVLFYQPKINLEDGTLMGMEALIRWVKPDGTIVPPSKFIPVAESSMLITKISDFVLHEACRQNKEWQDKGFPPITVSINLTAVDFYQTDVKEAIRSVLEETGMDARWLDVELTESLALKDIESAVQQMKEIRDLGVKLSMDDFGTGYSSLSYIQMLPITLLKLDRSFVMYLEDDEISREIVSAVIRIAKSKKIETIAEGIETIGQAEILKKSGCDQAQGYFFGKPMPADKFEEFMAMKAHERAALISAASGAEMQQE
ncbi:MAG: EAL domain-containing protein [Oscillospiraceae bacterium]|nr:EAL domain-containing protein [Oscillospiraceae bacterium]